MRSNRNSYRPLTLKARLLERGAQRRRSSPPQAVFFCYRRTDQTAVGRFHDRLLLDFEPECIFMDTSSIRIGHKWQAKIVKAIQACRVVLVMVGPDWEIQANDAGLPRIKDPHDPLHTELRLALSSRKIVIPVLMDRNALPSLQSLPTDIRELLHLQAAKLRPEDFSHDADELVFAIMDAIDWPQEEEQQAQPPTESSMVQASTGPWWSRRNAFAALGALITVGALLSHVENCGSEAGPGSDKEVAPTDPGPKPKDTTGERPREVTVPEPTPDPKPPPDSKEPSEDTTGSEDDSDTPIKPRKKPKCRKPPCKSHDEQPHGDDENDDSSSTVGADVPEPPPESVASPSPPGEKQDTDMLHMYGSDVGELKHRDEPSATAIEGNVTKLVPH